jgi:3-oxoacyl-[acyl-carrier protein] reductase
VPLHADLNGRVALVTGASSGIGRTIAVTLANCGASVIINYAKNKDGAEETQRQVGTKGAWICQANVADPDAVARMFAEIVSREPRLDIMVNNAGDPVAYEEIADCTSGTWDAAMAVNLRGVFLCAQAALRLMQRHRYGRIINVTSVGAVEGGSAGTMPYAAAKGAVETFTRGLARVAGPDKITVNAVAPGSIRTAMQDRFLDTSQIEQARSKTALRRSGKPEEVAAAVLFLASDEAGFITGQVIRVDGGRSA